MTEKRGPDAWLIDANKAWQERASKAEERAMVAERNAARTGDAVLRARSAVRRWRHTAVIAWAWLVAELAQTEWHWSRWCVIPIVGATASGNGAVDYWRIRRRAKQESARLTAERRAFIAERRQEREQ